MEGGERDYSSTPSAAGVPQLLGVEGLLNCLDASTLSNQVREGLIHGAAELLEWFPGEGG